MSLNERGGTPENDRQNLSESQTDESTIAGKAQKPRRQSLPKVPPRDGLTRTQEGQLQSYTHMVTSYYDTREKSPDDERLPFLRKMIHRRRDVLKQDPVLNQARIDATRNTIKGARKKRHTEIDKIRKLFNTQ